MVIDGRADLIYTLSGQAPFVPSWKGTGRIFCRHDVSTIPSGEGRGRGNRWEIIVEDANLADILLVVTYRIPIILLYKYGEGGAPGGRIDKGVCLPDISVMSVSHHGCIYKGKSNRKEISRECTGRSNKGESVEDAYL
jgi:hypothetical protein